MSTEEDLISTHIENVDVNAENGSHSEKSSDSGVETMESCSETFPASSDSEISPTKSSTTDQEDIKKFAPIDETSAKIESLEHSSLSSPVSTTPDDSPIINSLNYESSPSKVENSAKDISEVTSDCSNEATNIPTSNMYEEKGLQINSSLATSTLSLDEQNSNSNIICKSPYSRSAENLLTINKSSLNSSENELNKEKILSQFSNQKTKVTSFHKIPESIPLDNAKTDLKAYGHVPNIDGRYPRIPKEILSQDIGSIVKNVHGIFSSVSGSLKYAYNQRSAQKPIKTTKPVPNGKVMNYIFEDETNDALIKEKEKYQPVLESTTNLKVENVVFTLENQDDAEISVPEMDTKKDVVKLQVETLEKLLIEQRKENASLRERVKLQADQLHEKDQTFKEIEIKLDLVRHFYLFINTNA